MEIPLVLRARADGSIVYGIPRLFRAAMAAIVALLAVALFIDGQSPGVGGWVALGIAALGGLYEERWTFDPKAKAIVHRVGLVFLARSRTIALGDAARLRFVPFVRGTVPGSADEAEENAAALAGGRADDVGRRRARHKKPYLCLLCETEDGSRYFVNAAPARKGAVLKAQASRIAEVCGLPLVEG
jgi:hypothetical protein